ncbi:MAG: glycosyltransferase [Nitrospinota bacterium]|nr:glycosyltransferase [Nitrospinota bacterium]
MPKTALIIPCYNEEKRLAPEQYHQFLEKHFDIDLIFVDDGSSDGTFALLELIASQNPGRVLPLRLEQNSGKAEAVRHGVRDSFERGYEFSGYWDADNATPLRLAPELIADLRDRSVEMVMGSRVNILGKYIHRSQGRHYLGRIFGTLASFILGLQIYDTQCGAKVFRNGDVMRRAFGEEFETGWTFDLELIARAILAGREKSPGAPAHAIIIEHPLDEWVDVPGSKLKASHGLRIFRDLWIVYLRYHGRI